MTCKELAINRSQRLTVSTCIGLLVQQVLCQEFSQCFDEFNVCFWTIRSGWLNQAAAEATCQRRNDSFLPRITNKYIQSKLSDFRIASSKSIGGNDFWIDVKAIGYTYFHWIDGSSFAGYIISVVHSVINNDCTLKLMK